MGVADQAHALGLRVEAQLGEQGREHVLPHRVARARVVEPDPAIARSLGSSSCRYARFSAREGLLGPARGQLGAARELVQRDVAAHGEVVVAGQADVRALAPSARSRRPARRRSRRCRPGTRSRSTSSSSISASTASRAWRLPWMSEMTAMRMSNGGNVSEVDRGRTRLPIALVAVVVVAEGAVLLLRPRGGVIDPAPVSVRSYFSGQELARARDFRRPQLALYAGQLAVELGVLVWLVAPPAPVAARPVPPSAAGGRGRRRCAVGRAHGRAAAAGGDRAPARDRRRPDARSRGAGGPATSSSRSAIGAVFAGAGGGAAARADAPLPARLVAPRLGRRSSWSARRSCTRGRWCSIRSSTGSSALPPGRARSDVLELARKAGVKVGQVYEVDASRRTTAANAYVTGLGRTKRVVLYDTLLKRFSREETNLVVAHELGHVHYRDVPRGLLYLVLVAPAALFGAARLTERWRPPDARPGAPAMLPAAALALGHRGLRDLDRVQPALAARRAARGLLLAAAHRASPGRSSRPRSAWRCRTSPTPTRPRGRPFLLATHPPTIERIGDGASRSSGGVVSGSGRLTLRPRWLRLVDNSPAACPGDVTGRLRRPPGPRQLRVCKQQTLRCSGQLVPLRGSVAARTRPLLLAAVFFFLALELREVLDALAGAPLGVVVLHGVDQLAHEARGEVDARRPRPRGSPPRRPRDRRARR